ncbi:MAG: hypothetical protein AAFX99_15945, partial [Myxococcota bacterium]
KTNFGLIYEFPDDDSLRNWLSVRDNLDGYKLSRDGKSFKDLSEFPALGARSRLAGYGIGRRRSRSSREGGRCSAPKMAFE